MMPRCQRRSPRARRHSDGGGSAASAGPESGEVVKVPSRPADHVPVMVDNRLRFGPLLSVLGAALLGGSVFLPWYALSLTPSGAASAQEVLNNVAHTYGNTSFQARASSVGAEFSAFAGHQLATLSAHELL